jgi:protein involved in polysaccharide export with SLBB domain
LRNGQFIFLYKRTRLWFHPTSSWYPEEWVMRLIIAIAVLALLSACANTPSGIAKPPESMAEQARINTPPIADYQLTPGDKLEFRVYNALDMDTIQIVRPDGRITLPLIEDINVAGMTMSELRARLVQAYKSEGFLTDQSLRGLNLTILEFGSNKVYVGGEVKKPGFVPYTGPTTVARTIIEAGDITVTSAPSQVILYRRDGSYQVVDYKAALSGDPSKDIAIRPNDIVYVPRSRIGDIALGACAALAPHAVGSGRR